MVVDPKTQEDFQKLMSKGMKADEEAALRYLAFQNKLREQQLMKEAASEEGEGMSGKKQKVPLPSDEVNYVAESRLPGGVRPG